MTNLLPAFHIATLSPQELLFLLLAATLKIVVPALLLVAFLIFLVRYQVRKEVARQLEERERRGAGTTAGPSSR